MFLLCWFSLNTISFLDNRRCCWSRLGEISTHLPKRINNFYNCELPDFSLLTHIIHFCKAKHSVWVSDSVSFRKRKIRKAVLKMLHTKMLKKIALLVSKHCFFQNLWSKVFRYVTQPTKRKDKMSLSNDIWFEIWARNLDSKIFIIVLFSCQMNLVYRTKDFFFFLNTSSENQSSLFFFFIDPLHFHSLSQL